MQHTFFDSVFIQLLAHLTRRTPSIAEKRATLALLLDEIAKNAKRPRGGRGGASAGGFAEHDVSNRGAKAETSPRLAPTALFSLSVTRVRELVAAQLSATMGRKVPKSLVAIVNNAAFVLWDATRICSICVQIVVFAVFCLFVETEY